jgi:hypothetical protein
MIYSNSVQECIKFDSPCTSGERSLDGPAYGQQDGGRQQVEEAVHSRHSKPSEAQCLP